MMVNKFESNEVATKVETSINCKKCGCSEHTKAGKSSWNESQRYQCKNCGFKFTQGDERRDRPAQDKKCPNPKCGERNAVKDGKTTIGSQRYLCRSCFKSFSYGEITEK